MPIVEQEEADPSIFFKFKMPSFLLTKIIKIKIH